MLHFLHAQTDVHTLLGEGCWHWTCCAVTFEDLPAYGTMRKGRCFPRRNSQYCGHNDFSDAIPEMPTPSSLSPTGLLNNTHICPNRQLERGKISSALWCLNSSGRERELYLPQINTAVSGKGRWGRWRLRWGPSARPVTAAVEHVVTAQFTRTRSWSPPQPKDTSADTLTEPKAILAEGALRPSLLCRTFAARRPALAKKVAAKITRDFTLGNMLSPYGLHINNTKQVLHKQCSNNKYQRN